MPRLPREGRVREDSHITIRIPAGVATGSQLRIAGEGDAGVHGGPTGDLHVFIDVKPHDIFQREGNDLSCTVPVPLSLAVSGGRLKVPTLEGAATIKLPEGTQNGMIFRLRGKGVKALRGSDVGDMLVEVEVEIPSRLTKEQVDKLNAFASALDENRLPPVAHLTLCQAVPKGANMDLIIQKVCGTGGFCYCSARDGPHDRAPECPGG